MLITARLHRLSKLLVTPGDLAETDAVHLHASVTAQPHARDSSLLDDFEGTEALREHGPDGC